MWFFLGGEEGTGLWAMLSNWLTVGLLLDFSQVVLNVLL